MTQAGGASRNPKAASGAQARAPLAAQQMKLLRGARTDCLRGNATSAANL